MIHQQHVDEDTGAVGPVFVLFGPTPVALSINLSFDATYHLVDRACSSAFVHFTKKTRYGLTVLSVTVQTCPWNEWVDLVQQSHSRVNRPC